MINNNKKTTILLTSMTLSLILLLPSVAFAEDPDDCAIGTGNVGGSVTVDPSFKVEIDAIGDTFVTYAISIPAIGPPVSCNATIGFFGDPLITVNGIEVTIGGDCALPGANVPLGDGDTIQLWGDNSEYGLCNIAADLVEGTNLIFGFGNVGQFNNQGNNASFQSATNSAQRDVYTACIDVEKTGPAKVLLDESGEAIVEYTVTITNCADEDSQLPSNLDNCVLDDTVAGPNIPVPGVIAPGENTQVMYMAEINGDTPNTATVTCEDQEDIAIMDSDDHTVLTYTAGITVLKTAPAKVADEDQVIWNVKITNDGSSSIDNCEIDDPAFGFFDDITCAAPIAPGGMCSVEIPGFVCVESSANTVFVTCEDQEDQDVEGQDTADPPFCADFSVDIDKVCDEKVVVVPGNDADPIDCRITVTNDGPGTLTNCLVSDTLSGVLGEFSSTFTPDQSEFVDTQTAVTQQMIDDMEVTNTATVVCDTQEEFPPVEDEAEDTIQIRSVDATVEKMCEPATQTEPGVIDWEWWITNTSPDGKSDLTVDCEGVSTLNDPEIQDFFSNVLTFTESQTHNMWTESELDPGVYENMITCTFTAQDDRTFERDAMASCEVEPDVEVRGCTPGYWKGNAKGATNACMWSEPTDTPLNSIFAVSDTNLDNKGGTDTLLDALKFQGGNCAKDGTERQLLRMAVAAKLNIEADFDYEIADLGALQTLVNDAINHPTDRCGEMKTVKNQLGEFNEGPEDFEEEFGESFCPLSNSVNACPTD